MGNDVHLFVNNCPQFSCYKTTSPIGRAKLQNYQAGAPMDWLHLDVLGPFLESKSVNRYIHVIIDLFTQTRSWDNRKVVGVWLFFFFFWHFMLWSSSWNSHCPGMELWDLTVHQSLLAGTSDQDLDHIISSSFEWPSGKIQKNIFTDDMVLCASQAAELGWTSPLTHCGIQEHFAFSDRLHTNQLMLG